MPIPVSASSKARSDPGPPQVLLGSASPVASSGSLDDYKRHNVTTNIGTEVHDLQLSSILSDDDAIRDLAVLVSQRTVVFFRKQDLKIEDQNQLCAKLGALTGGPSKSKLHIHPLTRPNSKLGDEVLVVANSAQGGGNVLEYAYGEQSKFHSVNIHSDVTYERYAPSYAILKLVKTPDDGGDTLWFSGYELYDKLSPSFRHYLEGLTAQHNATFLHEVAKKDGYSVRTDLARGHPENIGAELESTHPVIRTNPVTGYKSVFVNCLFTKRINGVSKDESDIILAYLYRLQAENHDLAVRFKWYQNDIVRLTVCIRLLHQTDCLSRLSGITEQGRTPLLSIRSELVKAIDPS